MNSIWDSFMAFNQNALVYLAYTVSNNLWYLLIALGAATSIFFFIKEEKAVTVHEEQRAI
ncbi:MAG: hypothetical protein IJ341_01885 [Bacteroidales bacterium]|nr:hypothetical protein [Bacteroidales bacterium]